METAMTNADFFVEKSVCATLGAKTPDSDPEKNCVLDMLVTAAHSPYLSAEECRVMHRLADLLHVAWTRSWDSSEARAAPADNLHEIRCYVPPCSLETWEAMLQQAELNARMCGLAATILRYQATILPQSGLMRRTQEWIEANKAQQDGAGAEVPEIAPLPFNAEDLKLHLKTTSEAQKALRMSLPQPKAKAKAAAASEGADEPKPKRLRGKTAA
eukprot:s1676_g16.t1